MKIPIQFRALPLALALLWGGGEPARAQAVSHRTLNPNALFIARHPVAAELRLHSWENLPEENRLRVSVLTARGLWAVLARVEQHQIEGHAVRFWEVALRRSVSSGLFQISAQQHHGFGSRQHAFGIRMEQPFWRRALFDAGLELFPKERNLAPRVAWGITFREGRFASRLGVPENTMDLILSLGLSLSPKAEVALLQQGNQSGLSVCLKPGSFQFLVAYRSHPLLGGGVETRLAWGVL